ncbi:MULTISPECIES: permease prefix domain 1-containing protein [Heyndrickxia]|jgi:hypothetical protein|uniref:permease prefix domain 1-containing protein n=1 Tax=Heyndrickxia TaxID=2837504 RepID=UPI00217CE3F3|nr:permease prefix domain 1-containing protein [Heyndrickxia oleronia]MCI1589411.1 permease prefix domain 1-containing protein [Heyndrickxia oleronia]MCI1612641.1 permease prefix domain 1-containing protein [Heyndrickxia oleronia]MCI1743869.1 permease prefix domain 1-containing protein [Heyndrickxia oleronia]MCI1760590.1 permease prefix domain 1-containing protein [Heyndrickxia oleronia]
MLDQKAVYLKKLKQSLGNHPEKDLICREISSHIAEGIRERMLYGISEKEALDTILSDLGDPTELGQNYHLPVEGQNKTTMAILLNWCFFIGGILLTIMNQMFHFPGLHQAWIVLERISQYILLLYSVYWFFLGFTIGKVYGPKGKKCISQIVMRALIPNLLLMILVLSNMIPKEFYSPLLDPIFIILCMIATILFYPISRVAFNYGIVHGL